MAGVSKGVNDLKREKLNYEGYQAKDWIADLLNEKGIMQVDLARMISVSPKTVSFWMTGVSFPNPSAARSLVNVLAPGFHDEVARGKFILDNLAIYESIRKTYLKTTTRYDNVKKRGE